MTNPSPEPDLSQANTPQQGFPQAPPPQMPYGGYGGYISYPQSRDLGVPTSGLAITSATTGVITFVLGTFLSIVTLGTMAVINVLGAIPTVTGFLALGDIKRTGKAGRGAAIFGVVVGMVALFALLAWLVIPQLLLGMMSRRRW